MFDMPELWAITKEVLVLLRKSLHKSLLHAFTKVDWQLWKLKAVFCVISQTLLSQGVRMNEIIHLYVSTEFFRNLQFMVRRK